MLFASAADKGCFSTFDLITIRSKFDLHLGGLKCRHSSDNIYVLYSSGPGAIQSM